MIEKIKKGMSEIEDINPEKWSLKGNQLFVDQQMIKKREKIAINAKEISVGSGEIWVWAAVDLRDETVIAVHVSRVKNNHTTRTFLKKIAKQCEGPLPSVFVNGEDWSKRAFEKVGFRYTPVAFGQGSVIETFLLLVDFRICRYLEKFASINTPKSMLWWIEGFAGYTNYWTTRS